MHLAILRAELTEDKRCKLDFGPFNTDDTMGAISYDANHPGEFVSYYRTRIADRVIEYMDEIGEPFYRMSNQIILEATRAMLNDMAAAAKKG